MVKHALKRTNPKGIPFVGVCMRCGQEGLTTEAIREDCPNPADLSTEECLMAAIRG